ncbi:MAG: hypothetical protein EOP50_03535 [Sphingobacteriales bacterium]|nr:MAG: hypothetical protein EOP50_03535 [Sphingobacteriales bacterium]
MPHKIALHLSLYENARHRELVRHEGRLFNLKQARAKLDQLDQYAEGLKAAGAQLCAEEINLERARLIEGRGVVQVLVIDFLEVKGHDKADKARQFLLAQGFQEASLRRYTGFDHVVLNKDDLNLLLRVSQEAAAAAGASAATSATTA